jgi:hypothetical protein
VGRGEIRLVFILRRVCLAILIQDFQFSKSTLSFFGPAPHIDPIDLLLGVSLNHLDNVLGGILVRRAWSTVLGEVVEHFDRILTSYGS